LIRARLGGKRIVGDKVQDGVVSTLLARTAPVRVEDISGADVVKVMAKIDKLNTDEVGVLLADHPSGAALSIYNRYANKLDGGGKKEALQHIGIHLRNGATEEDLKTWIDDAARIYLDPGHPAPRGYIQPADYFFGQPFDWRKYQQDIKRGLSTNLSPIPGVGYIVSPEGYHIRVPQWPESKRQEEAAKVAPAVTEKPKGQPEKSATEMAAEGAVEKPAPEKSATERAAEDPLVRATLAVFPGAKVAVVYGNKAGSSAMPAETPKGNGKKPDGILPNNVMITPEQVLLVRGKLSARGITGEVNQDAMVWEMLSCKIADVRMRDLDMLLEMIEEEGGMGNST
jgi:hypothetical protein